MQPETATATRILPGKERQLLICRGTGCESQKANLIYFGLENELKKSGLADKFELKFTGCHGLCQMGPTVVLEPEGTFYCNVKPEDLAEIVEVDLRNGGKSNVFSSSIPRQKRGAQLQGHEVFHPSASYRVAQLRVHQPGGP